MYVILYNINYYLLSNFGKFVFQNFSDADNIIKNVDLYGLNSAKTKGTHTSW